MRYAQVVMGKNNNEGTHFGIIEAKDFYYFLDAIRLLERAGVLTTKCLTEWLNSYLDWLLTSRQGQDECRSQNNHGTLYDLQVGSIAAYLGDLQQLVEVFRRCKQRILMQFEANGRQPRELARPIPRHYTCFNLQSWMNLATLAERCGEDLWGYSGSDGRSLKAALEWLLREWPSRPSEEPGFDPARLVPLYPCYRDHYGDVDGCGEVGTESLVSIKPIYSPYDGIPPFWTLTHNLEKHVSVPTTLSHQSPSEAAVH
jgi:hypothetical protein